jgi:glycosyltransferase involved in cell wall biosynthesis
LRLAVLAHSFPRFPGDTHGPFVKRLSEELARLGHQVWALVPYDQALAADPATPLRVRSFRYVWPPSWHRLGYSRTLRRDRGLRFGALFQSPLYFACAERALARLVRAERIELVHAHWILPNGYVAWRAARRMGVPYAVTLHGSDVFMAERHALLGHMASRALAGAAHVTSCSAELAERLVRVAGGRHAEKVVLVPNGTDVVARPAAGAARAWRQRLGVEADAPLVVAVGRMVDKKGFAELLAAAPAILERQPRARLVLAGGGDLLETLRRRAEELGIAEAVRFPGALAHPEALALIAACDVFVMPSVRDAGGNVDGLPIVVLEAMAAARPVVATAVSGLPLAIADGQTGRLVAERDPAALAAAIVELIEDAETARRLGDAAAERVRTELNWTAVARAHDRLMRRAVGAMGPMGDNR